MDPISALGVASAAITFSEFVKTLISTGKNVNELLQSAHGATADNLKLEEVYSQLLDFSARLVAPSTSAPPGPGLQPVPFDSSAGAALRELSASCQSDCQELLDILDRLKVQSGSDNVWKTVKTAIKNDFSKKKISNIESRLGRTQRLMSLHASGILRFVNHPCQA
jgi:hypothetical protein